jgi:hypothetical protein
VAPYRPIVLAGTLVALSACSGSYWAGHYHPPPGGSATRQPTPPPPTDGGVPSNPPIGGGSGSGSGSGGGGYVPTYECTENTDCAMVECTCDNGDTFTVEECDNGVCLNSEDCPDLCGDTPVGADPQ